MSQYPKTFTRTGSSSLVNLSGYVTASSASTQFLTPSTASSSYHSINSPVIGFKNKIINGDFRIHQRLTNNDNLTLGSAKYGPDMWRVTNGASFTRSTFTPGNEISNYEPRHYITVSNSPTSWVLGQAIEDVRILAGKTATLSFWAKTTITGQSVVITPKIRQVFNESYNGSAPVTVTGSNITLTNSWVRYSQTFSIPSIVNKTISQTLDAGGPCLDVRIENSSGLSTQFWGFQLEEGPTATQFEERPISLELQMCQRYYQAIRPYIDFTAAASSQIGSVWSLLPVSMAFSPNVSQIDSIPTGGQGGVPQNTSGTTFTSVSVNPNHNTLDPTNLYNTFYATATSSAAGRVRLNRNVQINSSFGPPST